VSGSGVDWGLNLIQIFLRATVKHEGPADRDEPKRRDRPSAREQVETVSGELTDAQAARQQAEAQATKLAHQNIELKQWADRTEHLLSSERRWASNWKQLAKRLHRQVRKLEAESRTLDGNS
jgi:hypothetical protein